MSGYLRCIVVAKAVRNCDIAGEVIC